MACYSKIYNILLERKGKVAGGRNQPTHDAGAVLPSGNTPSVPRKGFGMPSELERLLGVYLKSNYPQAKNIGAGVTPKYPPAPGMPQPSWDPKLPTNQNPYLQGGLTRIRPEDHPSLDPIERRTEVAVRKGRTSGHGSSQGAIQRRLISAFVGGARARRRTKRAVGAKQFSLDVAAGLPASSPTRILRQDLSGRSKWRPETQTLVRNLLTRQAGGRRRTHRRQLRRDLGSFEAGSDA